MQNHTEIEVKIPLAADRSWLEKRLADSGFHLSAARSWESNEVFDTEDQSLRKQGMLLRLRQSGDRALLTWKGPSQPGVHKSRPELETGLESIEAFRDILTQLGYRCTFRYEKYRAEYQDEKKQGVVTLDETPVGDFLEIEGPPEWIDLTAERLGFSPRDYVLESYGQLYLNYCKAHNLEPGHMVFASHLRGSGVRT